MSTDNLANLICGDYRQHSYIESIYEVIFHNISIMERKLVNITDEDITILGPYYARSLLESVCTALVGRLDPFRLIYLQKVQSLDSFSIGKKAKSAISWFGDIFQPGENINNIWNSEKDFSKVGRGLFGDPYGEIFWNPAYKNLIDDSDFADHHSLNYYLTAIDGPEKFTKYIRQEASKLYSSLSKGVHSELIIEPEIIYDKTTVGELIVNVIKLSSIIGIVSHRIDCATCRLPFDNAFQYYENLYEWSENYDV
ncbi:hypothetical protein SAMN04487943_102462 [Gracilibacillus orientalis]|uniref:Uncharacterized protein n=1 Tax=Gracilibacillus orientalis TaxID=334253 RepID=A0A1I4J5X3_9BACI|nr:hypothetical protein [Gracilibacillus orientalis]SFL61486.1 hypothetical protein SAMN04487943_102462 [Gracilibacillus orientalis]